MQVIKRSITNFWQDTAETGYSSEKYCKTLERALLEDGEGSGVEEMMDIFSDIFMEGVIE